MHQAFRVHMLNEKGKSLASEIAGAFDELATRLASVCPLGREFAIVVTKLEEACFFAKKSIANVEANQADAATTIIDRPVTVPTVTPIGADTRPDLPASPPTDETTIVATKGVGVAPTQRHDRDVALALEANRPPVTNTNAEDQPPAPAAAASATPPAEAKPAADEPADKPNAVELFRQAKRAARGRG